MYVGRAGVYGSRIDRDKELERRLGVRNERRLSSLDVGALLIVLVVLGSTAWLYFDARRLTEETGELVGRMGAGEWALASIILWIIVFPMYLWRRAQLRREIAPPPVDVAPPGNRFCDSCGAALRSGAAFCPACGVDLRE